MRAFTILLSAAAVAALASKASALMIAMKSPSQRALSAEVVVIGKVTAIEKDTIEATPFPKSPQKLQYKVAVLEIQQRLAGAENLTHLKVGFIPAPPPPQGGPAAVPGQPALVRPIAPRRPFLTPDLKVGDEFLFFLDRHPDGGFYLMPGMSPPIAAKGAEEKQAVEGIKKVLAVVADPAKALESGKAQDRYFAAATLILKYRSYPDIPGVKVEPRPIGAEESKRILAALAGGDWTKFDRDAPNGMQAFNMLGLTPQDGFVRPRPMPAKPGQAPVNFNQLTQEAFVQWLTGPGKDYRIKKLVPKE